MTDVSGVSREGGGRADGVGAGPESVGEGLRAAGRVVGSSRPRQKFSMVEMGLKWEPSGEKPDLMRGEAHSKKSM